MHCLRHVLIFALLIPMPSASPFFLAVFAVAAYWAIRPCGYCVTMLAILFFSTSPSSPFIAALAPDTPTPEPTPADASIPAYDEHIADRGAFYLNGGRIFDPVLVGYREMQRAWSDSAVTNSTGTATANAETGEHGQGTEPTLDKQAPADLPKSGPASWPGRWKLGLSSLRSTHKEASKSQSRSGAEKIAKPPVPPSEAAVSDSVSANARLSQQALVPPPSPSLPPGYVDLRIGGIGFVVDLGWRRTDQGLHWEVDDVRHARATRDARRRGSSTVPGAKSPASVLGTAVDEGSSDEGKAKASRRNSWLGASFVGSW
ncbi:hypothetical protein Q8F55_007928 [Vanrija albida]|uniref:Uncharacterized protein n=1 Tax=Vanrija albida TaxID=181172 RepID=A0ABR3PVT0_9TREE